MSRRFRPAGRPPAQPAPPAAPAGPPLPDNPYRRFYTPPRSFEELARRAAGAADGHSPQASSQREASCCKARFSRRDT